MQFPYWYKWYWSLGSCYATSIGDTWTLMGSDLILPLPGNWPAHLHWPFQSWFRVNCSADLYMIMILYISQGIYWRVPYGYILAHVTRWPLGDETMISSMCKLIIQNSSLGTLCEIAFRWIPQNLSNEKLTMVLVMAWCHQSTRLSWADVDPDLCCHMV